MNAFKLIKRLFSDRPRRNRTLARAVALTPENFTPEEKACVEDIISALNDDLYEQWMLLENILQIELTRDEAIDLLRHLNAIERTFDELQASDTLCYNIGKLVQSRRDARIGSSIGK